MTMLKILILIGSMLLAASKNACPSKVADEMELASLSP